MKVLLIIVAAVIVLWSGVGLVFFLKAMAPRRGQGKEEDRVEAASWAAHIGRFTIKAFDKAPLAVMTFTQAEKTSDWVIIAHGHMAWKEMMFYAAKELYQRGFNVLVFDLRGHGESGGGFIGMGWPDRLDIVRLSQWLVEQYGECRINLYGVSMGAATVMMASGEDLPAQVKSITADCGYTGVADIFSYQVRHRYHLPPWLILLPGSVFTKILGGYNMYKASTAAQIMRNTRPLFLIHGENDTYVPTKMVHVLYEAAGGEAKLLIAPGAGHGEAHQMDGYWDKIRDFFLE